MVDRRHQDNGQGDVKHPETDRRLKENRGSGYSAKGSDDGKSSNHKGSSGRR